MNFDLSQTWQFLLQGLGFTIQVTLVGMIGGMIFGSLLAVACFSTNSILSGLAKTYVNLMRSIPLILVIFWVFFLVPWAIGWITQSAYPIPVGVSMTAFVTFALFEAAYYAEVIRSGLRSIPTGQYSASRALALSKHQTYIYVIFPQAIRNAMPIILTQTIILFQDTSLVYVISATDLLGAATTIAQRDGNLVEMYTVVTIIYFGISIAASQLVKMFERKASFGKRA